MNSDNHQLLSAEEILNNCSKCKNRLMDAENTMLCKLTQTAPTYLTDEKHSYDYICPQIDIDIESIKKAESKGVKIVDRIIGIFFIAYSLFKLIKSIFLNKPYHALFYATVMIIFFVQFISKNRK